MKGVQIDVVASNGQLIAKPLAGGAPNSLCATADNKPAEGPENQYMVASLFTCGKFRFLDLADLDCEKEMEREDAGNPPIARGTGFARRSSQTGRSP
jgi:hypothetical protein